MTTLNCRKIGLSGAFTASLLSFAAASTAADMGRGQTIEEVVVTAQKRAENLLEVPVPVTALSGESLVSNNQLRLQDWYTSIPGFTVAPQAGQGGQTLSLRGISTGLGNPTVGIAIDGIPYGNSSLLGGLAVPDFDPGDLARIEVLRGPQGTIYGSSSLGGLVNFVTTDPSTEGFSARVQTGVTSVKNGDGLGYNARGSVNVPLGDSVALRASAFTNHDAGYIDNPGRGIDGINALETNGGRLSLLMRMSDDLSLKLGALYQKQEYDGIGVVHGGGDLEQDFIVGTPLTKEDQNYSAVFAAKLGTATLTSLTGYNIQEFESNADASSSGTAVFLVAPLWGVPGVAQINDSKTKKFSQELRLAVPIGEKLETLVGAYYAEEDARWDTSAVAIDPTTQQVVTSPPIPAGAPPFFLPFDLPPMDAFLRSEIPNYGRERAAFANLTYRATERLDIQFGGRYSEFSGHISSSETGLWYNTVVYGQPVETVTRTAPDSNTHKFTYLVTPRFKITPDVMVYARFASGFRGGGSQTGSELKPDETRNYELGLKADLLDHSLSLAVSAYYIDWKDIQLFLQNPVTLINELRNGDTATSQGVELEFQSKPTNGLTISGWVGWNDAELTADIPPTSQLVGSDGDRLPYSQRLGGKLGVEQSFPVGGLTAFVGADVTYTDKRMAEFAFNFPGSVRRELPAYAQTNFRAGLESGSWEASLFVNNVTDRRGQLSRTGADNNFIIYNQPRTIGMSLSKSF